MDPVVKEIGQQTWPCGSLMICSLPIYILHADGNRKSLKLQASGFPEQPWGLRDILERQKMEQNGDMHRQATLLLEW